MVASVLVASNVSVVDKELLSFTKKLQLGGGISICGYFVKEGRPPSTVASNVAAMDRELLSFTKKLHPEGYL